MQLKASTPSYFFPDILCKHLAMSPLMLIPVAVTRALSVTLTVLATGALVASFPDTSPDGRNHVLSAPKRALRDAREHFWTISDSDRCAVKASIKAKRSQDIEKLP
jgi:hypothetical protein